SRLPSRTSHFGAMSGSLATTFSRWGGKKWIMRDGRTGISRRGSGAPTARGRKKSFGLRTASSIGVGAAVVVNLRRSPPFPKLPPSTAPCPVEGGSLRGVGTLDGMSALTGHEAEVVGAVPTELWIGGEWRPASEGGTHDVEDPSTGEVIASVADATVA